MKLKGVLAILEGTPSVGNGVAGKKPAIFIATEEMAVCVQQLGVLKSSQPKRTRPLVLSPMQLPPMF